MLLAAFQVGIAPMPEKQGQFHNQCLVLPHCNKMLQVVYNPSTSIPVFNVVPSSDGHLQRSIGGVSCLKLRKVLRREVKLQETEMQSSGMDDDNAILVFAPVFVSHNGLVGHLRKVFIGYIGVAAYNV